MSANMFKSVAHSVLSSLPETPVVMPPQAEITIDRMEDIVQERYSNAVELFGIWASWKLAILEDMSPHTVPDMLKTSLSISRQLEASCDEVLAAFEQADFLVVANNNVTLAQRLLGQQRVLHDSKTIFATISKEMVETGNAIMRSVFPSSGSSAEAETIPNDLMDVETFADAILLACR